MLQQGQTDDQIGEQTMQKTNLGFERITVQSTAMGVHAALKVPEWKGFNMSPVSDPENLYRSGPTIKYFKLFKVDLDMLSIGGGWNSPEEAFIPVAVYDKIKAHSMWAAPIAPVIQITARTATGMLILISCPPKSADPNVWEKIYWHATIGSEARYTPRSIDPKIDLFIHLPVNTRLSLLELEGVFAKAVGSQTCTVKDTMPDSTWYFVCLAL